jgi:hypothetical protein
MLTYVNHRGEPISTGPSGKAAVKKSSTSSQDSYHKGWDVLGFSPEHLAEARRLHELEPPAAGQERKPFDEAAYLRNAKPKKARSKPYGVWEAAEQCADLMRRAGWKVVTVQARAKGGK